MKKSKDKDNIVNFFSFLMQKEQKVELSIFLLIYALIYLLLYIFYPYPDVMADSGSYILSAKTMTISGYRPIGYSWFINFFHEISESIHFLSFAQYVLHVSASLFFLFTIKYFFPSLKKGLFYAFSLLVVLEPNAIYLTNMIMSDSIFNTLTLLFITSFFWYDRHGGFTTNFFVVIFHVIILYFAFNVRYTALFYPLLSLVFFVISSKRKLVGACIALLPIFIVMSSYIGTKKEMKEHIGINTFSGFSGWALANNAVSIIPYIDLKPEKITDRNSRFIHSVVTHYPDSVFNSKYIISTKFMWTKSYPGKQVLFQVIQSKRMEYIRGWNYTGDLMKEYAKMLIKKYPYQYFKHYIILNFKQLFKFFDIRNPKVYKPDRLQKEWFSLDIDEYKYGSQFFKTINPFLKIIHYLRWVLFFSITIFIFVKHKRLSFSPYQKRILVVVLFFLLCYYGFSILSHPINNFRYLVPSYTFLLFVPYLAINQYLRVIK